MSENPTDPKSALTPPRPEDYADYVEHPRFGKAPRYTGLDPVPGAPGVRLHWGPYYYSERVPGTAIKADISRQTFSPVPVTHYYDVKYTCPDCGRRFLFFAEEQKHWYEELGFPLESDAGRCPLCRKQRQNIARTRQRYEQLLAFDSLSVEETLEMADCCLSLVEVEVFSPRQCERVRMLLKRIPGERRSEEKFQDVIARLHAAEGKLRQPVPKEPSA